MSGKVVAKIKNTLSDRHAAEKLFNQLLHDFRAEGCNQQFMNKEPK